MKKENTKTTESRQNAEDAALEKFTDLLINKIETMQQDWKKPWFTEGGMIPARNLAGRNYNGANSLFLQLHCEKEGYQLPVFATFDRLQHLNFTQDRDGKWQFCRDKDGNKMPKVSVKKGEKSFPVFLTLFHVVNKENPKDKLLYDQYRLLSEQEREKYSVYPRQSTYYVFNVHQTNLKEARPELWKKLEEQCAVKRPEGYEEGDRFKFEAIDRMIDKGLWFCPINEVHGDEAYYSISKDSITVPERTQFINNESFYSNLMHECNHALHSSRFQNLLESGAGFSSKSYSIEELRSELGAAVVSAHYGMTKSIKADSCAYLKSWLDSLHEDPKFLKSILPDVKRSVALATQRIDKIQMDIDNGIESDKSVYDADTKAIEASFANKGKSKSAEQSHTQSSEEHQEETAIDEAAKAVVRHGRGR